MNWFVKTEQQILDPLVKVDWSPPEVVSHIPVSVVQSVPCDRIVQSPIETRVLSHGTFYWTLVNKIVNFYSRL